MYLYYDRIHKVFTLETEEEVEFLGPDTHALVKLRHKGLTNSQAREAMLQAIFNMGCPVDLDAIRKVASDSESAYFSVAA